jgi:hypothetical protein
VRKHLGFIAVVSRYLPEGLSETAEMTVSIVDVPTENRTADLSNKIYSVTATNQPVPV